MSTRKKQQQQDEKIEVSLETRLERLQEIVDALDSDDLELEKALGLFEEGIRHVKGAQTLLTEAELRVQELLGPEGALETQELEQEGE